MGDIPQQYTCKQCGRIVGVIRKIDNREFLMINGITVSYLRGLCECGEQIYWALSDRMLAELLKHISQNKYQV